MVGKGLFIAVEGWDGTGKSSQAVKLADWIFSNYKKINTVVLTHEPTRGKFGAEIYQRLHQANTNESAVAKERMLELYVLDREEHVNEIILPMLDKKAVVICDRYKYSTIAYQSAQGISIQHAIDENAGFPIPDITFIFNATIDNCIARLQKHGKVLDGFEKRSFLERVREQYLKISPLLPAERVQFINANQSIDEIHSDVVKAVKPFVDEMVK